MDIVKMAEFPPDIRVPKCCVTFNTSPNHLGYETLVIVQKGPDQFALKLFLSRDQLVQNKHLREMLDVWSDNIVMAFTDLKVLGKGDAA